MKNKTVFESFTRASEGLRHIFETHTHFKIELLLAAVTASLGYVLQITLEEWLSVFVAVALVLIAEIFNTCIEELGNLITLRLDPRMKRVKDMAGAAVLLSIGYSILVGIMIFTPRIAPFLLSYLTSI